MGERIATMPLFWRVFGANALVLALALALLALAPVTVSVPVELTELPGDERPRRADAIRHPARARPAVGAISRRGAA